MSFPNDILLPANAKKFGFVDTRFPYNIHWDINWSFSFALTGTEHGFSTFLTTSQTFLSALGGQYLGILTTEYPPYILAEDGEIVLSEDGEPILYDSALPSCVLSISFDTTGLCGLSAGGNPGIAQSEIRQNVIIVRDELNNILLYKQLSSLSTDFFLTSSVPVYQTLRFRVANDGKKLSIDYNKQNTDFVLLTSMVINMPSFADTTIAYPGFSFCSPISSLSTPSTLFLKNFHTQGNISVPTYDIKSYVPLSASALNNYTSISGISAYPSYD